MKPNLRAVDNERPHNLDIARQRIAQWRSNAQREGLPTTNVIDSGAPLLRRDEVVRGSYPTYEVNPRRSLWSKLFRR